MKANINQIKILRKKTAASYANCKKALIEAQGNLAEAEKLVRQKGLAIIESNNVSNTDQGVVCSYVHPGDRVGVLIEVKCKTDFVAKTEEFKQFAKEMAMQVAAMKPKYVSRADVPLDTISKEVGFRIERLAKDGITEKNEEFQKLLDAEMDHWYAEMCLLEQLYIRDSKRNVKDLLADLIAKVDETCRISRFDRWEIGKEETEDVEMPEVTENINIFNKFRIAAILILVVLFFTIILTIVS